MMSVLLLLFWLLTAATFQALAPAWHHWGEPAFPILPGVVIYVATHKPPRDFVWVAIAAGVLNDALSLAPLGYSSLSFMAAGGAAMLLREDFYPNKATVAMGVGGLCVAISTVVMGALLKWHGLVALPWGALFKRMLGSAFLGAVLCPLLFGLMRGMEKRLGTLDARI